MTIYDAKLVAEVIEQADSYCPPCVRGLVNLLNVRFPEFEWGFEGTNWKISKVTVAHKEV